MRISREKSVVNRIIKGMGLQDAVKEVYKVTGKELQKQIEELQESASFMMELDAVEDEEEPTEAIQTQKPNLPTVVTGDLSELTSKEALQGVLASIAYDGEQKAADRIKATSELLKITGTVKKKSKEENLFETLLDNMDITLSKKSKPILVDIDAPLIIREEEDET